MSPEQISIKADRNVLPQQWTILGKWPDNSIKWAQVVCPAHAKYEVDLSPARAGIAEAVQVVSSAPLSAVISSGDISLHVANNTAVLKKGPQNVTFDLSNVTTQTGDDLIGHLESLDVLESGPMRAVLRAKGLHRSETRTEGFLQFDVFLTLYAGHPVVEIDHSLIMVGGDKPENEMFCFKSASISVRMTPETAPIFSAFDSPGKSVSVLPGEKVFQWEKSKWAVDGASGITQQGEQADGVFIATTPSGSCFASVRDFWQQYPKAYTARDNGFDIELFPLLMLNGENPYSNRENEHAGYYYLKTGNYEIRQGASKSHRLFIGLQDTPEDAARVAGKLQEIPVVLPERSYVHQTKAIGPMPEPFSGGLFSDWDAAFYCGIHSYFAQREELEWYGLLNWGDWLGERQFNWSNHEYDLPETLFRQALRFHDPELMREALRQNAHRRDVDIVHAHSAAEKAGINWKHSIGHTGGYYPNKEDRKFSLKNYSHGDETFFEGSSTPGHTRTSSFFTDYFLTGNPRSMETGRLVADRLMKYDLFTKDNFNYMTAREPGWSMVSLAAAYRATGDVKYLNGATRMADLVISKSAGNGVWLRKLAPHQRGPEPENGELSFPTAFQAAGMIALYEITGRLDIKENILQTADYILNNLYRPEYKAFVHSPSRERNQTPRAGGTAGSNLRYILAYACALTGDEKFLDPVIDSFASMAANRQWCGTKVNPDRPYPHEISSAFYFMNEDQTAMNKAVGELFRTQRDEILNRAAPASIFPDAVEPWENVY